MIRDAGQHMVLEVTESATTSDVGRVLENLSRLRMKGFGLSIDDYGTGYSSMNRSRGSRSPNSEPTSRSWPMRPGNSRRG